MKKIYLLKKKKKDVPQKKVTKPSTDKLGHTWVNSGSMSQCTHCGHFRDEHEAKKECRKE